MWWIFSSKFASLNAGDHAMCPLVTHASLAHLSFPVDRDQQAYRCYTRMSGTPELPSTLWTGPSSHGAAWRPRTLRSARPTLPPMRSPPAAARWPTGARCGPLPGASSQSAQPCRAAALPPRCFPGTVAAAPAWKRHIADCRSLAFSASLNLPAAAQRRTLNLNLPAQAQRRRQTPAVQFTIARHRWWLLCKPQLHDAIPGRKGVIKCKKAVGAFCDGFQAIAPHLAN